MTPKDNIRKLLKKYKLKPNKRMGQNFLISQKALNKIIETADLSKKDIVLEIGPGLGILTQKLTKKTKKVIAVEKDKKIIEALKDIVKNYNNIKIIEGDILKMQKAGWWNNLKKYKVVANIPYYLTSPLIRSLLERENQPEEIILLVQKEVAKRICAKPPKMNLLALSVQFYSQPKIIGYVSKKSFWPQPKVDSAIIKIGQINKPKDIAIEKFFQIAKIGFSGPRKQLVNNLSKGLKRKREEIDKILIECGLDAKIRPGNLSVFNWINLTKKI